jgi:putative RNA 2'-phosphotransferase
MSDFLVRLSKTMARALRHAPADYGLTLEEGGWVELSSLAIGIRASAARWAEITEDDLRRVLAMASDKPRYEIAGTKIRARHGHSAPVDLAYQPEGPPEYLYHGTSLAALAAIRQGGLRAMRRQYVHLSAEKEMAGRVGARQGGQTVILVIAARAAAAEGVDFYQSSPAVWLAAAIPPQFIVFPEGDTPPISAVDSPDTT